MAIKRTRVGIIGCGAISDIYLQAGQKFEILEIAACADLLIDRAQAKAAEYSIAKACLPEELLADPDIEIVINLTIPQAHFQVAMATIEAGKSVYNEKPLTISLENGAKLLQAAAAANVRVGCAPDTFLGGGLQTCRKLIDDGQIGRPIAATAFMTTPGHERWHPNPEFYYQQGGGPMFDMGPYYLTALISMLGSVRRVTGSVQISHPERTITSQPKYGQKITVEVPTHVVGVLDFAQGAIGNIITSFDVWAAQLPFIEIYGTEGTLSLPDPNTFGGPVRLRRPGSEEWEEIPLSHSYTDNARGLGVAEMAYAIQQKRDHRANGEMAFHVLEIMHAIHTASEQGQHIKLNSQCSRPAMLPSGVLEETLATEKNNV